MELHIDFFFLFLFFFFSFPASVFLIIPFSIEACFDFKNAHGRMKKKGEGLTGEDG